MKNWPPGTVRLAQAALDTRDSLRRLAARIAAAGEDPQLRSEALAAAHQVATTHADLLRLALKDSGARPEVVHIPTRGKGFRCPEHCENCTPARSQPEAPEERA